MSTQKSRLTNTTLTVNATDAQINAVTSSAVNVYGDVSMNSRLFIAGNITTGMLNGGNLYLHGTGIASYIPTPITHFEQYTMSSVKWTNSSQGDVGSAFSVYFTRINNICHISIDSLKISASGNNYYWMNTLVPERFRATYITFIPITVEANSVFQSANTNLVLNTNGYVFAPITASRSDSLLGGSLILTGLDAGGGTDWTIRWPTITYYIQ